MRDQDEVSTGGGTLFFLCLSLPLSPHVLCFLSLFCSPFVCLCVSNWTKSEPHLVPSQSTEDIKEHTVHQ